MKTIKELEAELNLNKNFDLNNWKGDKTFDVGYREALKDVLGLIDEEFPCECTDLRPQEEFKCKWCKLRLKLKTKITG